jgi:hypothetical protein
MKPPSILVGQDHKTQRYQMTPLRPLKVTNIRFFARPPGIGAKRILASPSIIA